MAILTIADLQKATNKAVLEAKRMVTIKDDLYTYMKWLEESKTRIDIRFKLGGTHRSLGVHPSSVCKMNCQLRVLWEATGARENRKPFDFDMQDTFDIGTAKHVMLQTMLHDMFEDQFESEVALEIPELRIKGHADGVFTFDDVRFLLEIKTIKEGSQQYGIEKAQKGALTDHINQSTIYMKALDLPFALVFYWCKNNSLKVEQIVPFDPMVWEKLKAWVEPVVAAADAGEDVMPAYPGFHCKFCGFEYGCDAARRKDATRSERRARRVR